MQVFVGLGNPGSEYVATRHNIGFMAADAIIRRHSFSAPKLKFQAEISEGAVSGEKIAILKPMTYMNLSGKAVQEFLHFYKLTPESLTVFHDDIDLPLGKIRIKTGGGAGGNNGLKSIDSHSGPAYRRIRLGVGHPGDARLVSSYVLGKFTPGEASVVEKQLDFIAASFPLLVKGEDALFLNQYALAMNPAPPKPGAGTPSA